MGRRFVVGLGAAAFLAMSMLWSPPAATAAETLSLFVRKAQITSVVQNGKVYAPVTQLLKAMGYTWAPNGSTLQLSQGTTGGPDLKMKATALTFVLPNGKSVNADAISVRNELWVQVRPLAEAAGGTYIATPSAGIVQVVFPSSAITQKDLDRAVKDSRTQAGVTAAPITFDNSPPAKSDDKSDKTAQAGDKSGDKSGDKADDKGDKSGDASKDEKEKEPIEVVEPIEFSNPIIPGSKVPAELRGTATIKNTSDKRVTNIRFTVELRDLGDNPVATLPTKFISAMEPGETSSQDFLWYNYYNQTITPKVKVEHDPLPKKKKKSDKGDGKTDAKGDGKTDDKGDGKTDAKGDGKTDAKGDGKTDAKGDGKTDAKGDSK